MIKRFFSYSVDRFYIKQPKLRRLVTRFLEGDRDLDVQLLGTRLRINTVKEHGYLRAYRAAQTRSLFRDELPVLLNLAGILCDGDTFVDVGANVGIYCLTLARLAQVHSRMSFYAFEANSDTFSRLNVNAPGLGVITHNVALSDHLGSLEFVSGAVSHVFTTVDNASAYSLPAERIAVPCNRLDQMDIVGNSIVLKIDVEGQEKKVLDGAEALFRAGRIKAVYLDGYKDKTVEEFLTGYGLALFDGRTLQSTKGDVFSLLGLRAQK